MWITLQRLHFTALYNSTKLHPLPITFQFIILTSNYRYWEYQEYRYLNNFLKLLPRSFSFFIYDLYQIKSDLDLIFHIYIYIYILEWPYNFRKFVCEIYNPDIYTYTDFISNVERSWSCARRCSASRRVAHKETRRQTQERTESLSRPLQKVPRELSVPVRFCVKRKRLFSVSPSSSSLSIFHSF